MTGQSFPVGILVNIISWSFYRSMRERIKLFNQMSITVLIEEHLSKPIQFGNPSKEISLDTGTY